MLGLQFGIGAANDLADAVPDAAARAGKPIPAGLVSRGAALGVCVIATGLGLLTAATVGVGAFVVGALGLADGLVYDLRLKGTPLAWMPFAAGVGLLPLYAWLGAQGPVTVAVLGVEALCVLAGITLALANARADLTKDRISGIASVATFLGGQRTLLANAALLAVVQLIALATTLAISGATPMLAAEGCGIALGWFGVGFAGLRGDRAGPMVWEVQAVGILLLGAGWLAVLNSAGMLRG